MLALLALTALSANPKVAMLTLSGADLEPAQVRFFSEHVAEHLRRGGVEVVTEREIATILGMERQRQLLGCDDNSCFTELASALGADAIAMGDLAQLEPGLYQINLKLISNREGSVLVSRSGRVQGLTTVSDALAKAAYEMGRELRTVLRPNEPGAPHISYARHPVRTWSLLGVAAFAAGTAGAIAWLVDTSWAKTALSPGSPARLTLAEADTIAARGQRSQTLAIASLALACVGALSAAVLFFWADEPPSLALSLEPTGGAL